MERRKFLFFLPTLIVAPKVFVEVMTSIPDVLMETSIIVPRVVLTEAQIVADELMKVYSPLPTLFDRDDVFFRAIERGPMIISSRDMRIPLALKPGGQFDSDPISLFRNEIKKIERKIDKEAQKVIDAINADLHDPLSNEDYDEDD